MLVCPIGLKIGNIDVIVGIDCQLRVISIITCPCINGGTIRKGGYKGFGGIVPDADLYSIILAEVDMLV